MLYIFFLEVLKNTLLVNVCYLNPIMIALYIHMWMLIGVHVLTLGIYYWFFTYIFWDFFGFMESKGNNSPLTNLSQKLSINPLHLLPMKSLSLEIYLLTFTYLHTFCCNILWQKGYNQYCIQSNTSQMNKTLGN